jgi:endoribonuclease Dicer
MVCVYRFDLFESHVSNAYVRARTRGRESHLVFMVERANDAHRRILSQITQLDAEMRRWTDIISKRPSSSVPPNGLHETTDPYYSDSDDEGEQSTSSLRDPTTSGRIRPQDATAVIYRFASRNEFSGRSADPLFDFKELDTGLGVSREYSCTVSLPSLGQISGGRFPSQSLARRDACYQMCLELFNAGLLDYTLFPLPPKIARHVPPTAQGTTPTDIEAKSIGTRCYSKKQPDFWSNTVAIPLGGLLYPTIVSTNHSDEVSKPHAPMIILTRRPFPGLPKFKLFFSGVPAVVQLIQARPLSIEARQLRDLHMYTIRVCRAISNRPFVCPMEVMPYFFAPLRSTWKEQDQASNDLPSIADQVPWDLVALAAKSWVVALQTDPPEALTRDIEDAVVQDRWVEFTRRYDAVRMRPDLSPLSKPLDSPVCVSGSSPDNPHDIWSSAKQSLRTWQNTARRGAKTLTA